MQNEPIANLKMESPPIIEITMTSVQSSSIAEIGYDESAGELHVRFKTIGVVNNEVYIYPGVGKSVYEPMIRGDCSYNFSVGKHFDLFVKKVVDPKLVRKVVRP